MIFFTRELFLGLQPKSGWEQRAMRERNQRLKQYTKYAEVVVPLLPSSVRRLCKQGLHDGVVREAKLANGELMVVDATNALGGFRGRHVRLTFHGVRGRFSAATLVGKWWQYHESHLRSGGRFCLSILFDPTEVGIEADDLTIEGIP